MGQNEQNIYRNRKYMDLSDYYVSVILNIANVTEVCELWLPLACSIFRETLYLDGGQERAHSNLQFQIASTCKTSKCIFSSAVRSVEK